MKTNNLLKQDGILLLNKSVGMTSNTALQKAKRLLGAKKVGHTGSLDPLATGMLPLCFGEATKVCQFLLDADKCYETTGLLGIKTNTADATGEVTARVERFSISTEQLLDVLMQHTGHIKQVPSMFSALKHHGTPLYRLAREGVTVERKAREILISDLQLTAFDGIQFSLTVRCSKGTYIRNLVEDIGDALGVGAHVTRLHRVYTAGLENMPMYTLDEIEAMSMSERMACLIPMDKAVDHLEQITLLDDEIVTIRQGRIVTNKVDVEVADCVRLYDERAQFIGLGERNIKGDIKAKRLLSF
ncbi:tRNA pseudouridine(55) synthase TruB [Fluoribacter dumoffii]|uniref:tRNA pseudouridine synthase B n=1 Tax=Fluoribacter dumoffii TaxID=463 RepID=A0A377G621_9GAMM|nr:tRNA pseudouridine(55) synthase TruB [Fluoribacter dumoffii]KTC91724.1 tRNA pseudouridine synthase B [Fluoribacter dumoffii NY 23]MCW8417345.1 tRNA pseudouridine(55) synthase TruB [Fluoribacter dumoffii]MCW8454814.1 tRNA pseudouridine(55) synthase TruB [Fluoribacter dumoffii]MCW8461109.1 tRNA pseudouridine(55) synthase TruB [Fluoribacter dumoffii]MCW8484550.1 tRNA pseudouridine(55) synthase TruB [Fluoribacter dumoffii]